MTTIRIVGQPRPEDDWLHRFRNFGENVYVEFRDECTVEIAEIDAAVDTFHLRDVPSDEAAAVTDRLARMLEEHHLDDSVFVLPADAERSGCTVVVVTDPACGERLWTIAVHDTWVVPSEMNRAAVEPMREARKRGNEGPSITIWSEPRTAVTEGDWLGLLQTIDMHHGELASDPPMDTLTVYGTTLTPAITAALREYDFGTVQATGLGFMAFKRKSESR